MTADDIYNLMKAVQAQLEIILKREEPITRAELAEYSKIVKAQAAPSLDPVKLAQQLMPQLIAQLPKQLPLKVEPNTEEIVKLLSPVINKQVTDIQATNERLLQSLPQHLANLDEMLAARLQGLKDQDASLGKTADRFPRKVEVDFVRSWLNLVLVALGPLLAVLIILGICGAFSKEPVATFNDTFRAYRQYRAYSSRLEKQNDSLRRVEFTQRKELNFYRSQVHQYRKKFPKSAPYLPPFLPAKK
jgi:hypothetical protein